MKETRVGILTAGGLAPCLSSAVGRLIERYNEIDPSIEIICYKNGYHGLLKGDKISVTPEIRKNSFVLQGFGGSPIGNSRVKLTNVENCVKNGLVKEGEIPLEVACNQLSKDKISILHTIGGDDTNTTAADLAAYLKKVGHDLIVVGLPKTVDNDIYPIEQSLGAWSAAINGALFFQNVVSESSANPKMLIVHEVMGRNCGWLTFATAFYYHNQLWKEKTFMPEIGLKKEKYAIHGIYVPEISFDIEKEAIRLKNIMETNDCVNIFVSEGAGVQDILKNMEEKGETIPKDAFGHVKLDAINPGKWFGTQFGKMIGAEKVLTQKSGYFARSAPAHMQDIRLIQGMVDFGVSCALNGQSGVIGHDIENNCKLGCIEFTRIKGGKHLDPKNSELISLLKEIGQ